MDQFDEVDAERLPLLVTVHNATVCLSITLIGAIALLLIRQLYRVSRRISFSLLHPLRRPYEEVMRIAIRHPALWALAWFGGTILVLRIKSHLEQVSRSDDSTVQPTSVTFRVGDFSTVLTLDGEQTAILSAMESAFNDLYPGGWNWNITDIPSNNTATPTPSQ